MLSKARATGPDTTRSPKGLPGEDMAGVGSACGFLRLRRRGGRSADVEAGELELSAGKCGVSGLTVAVRPWGSKGIGPGSVEAWVARLRNSAASFRLTVSSMGKDLLWGRLAGKPRMQKGHTIYRCVPDCSSCFPFLTVDNSLACRVASSQKLRTVPGASGKSP